MEPTLTVTENGFLINADGATYILEWFGKMLKVTGPDVCYYILETVRGIEQANCTLSALSILIANY
jgi:hypothetical protein